MSKYKTADQKTESAQVVQAAPPVQVAKREDPEVLMTSEDLAKLAEKMESDIVCSLDNPEDCLSCGS